MLTGTLVTMAGLRADRVRESSAGEYTFSIFAVVSIALIVSWFVAVIFAPLLGVVLLSKPQAAARPRRARRGRRVFRRLLIARHAAAMGHASR